MQSRAPAICRVQLTEIGHDNLDDSFVTRLVTEVDIVLPVNHARKVGLDDLIDGGVRQLRADRPEGHEVHLEFLLGGVFHERRGHRRQFTFRGRVIVKGQQNGVAFIQVFYLVKGGAR